MSGLSQLHKKTLNLEESELSFLEAMGLSDRIRVDPGKRMNLGLKVAFVRVAGDLAVK